MTTKGYKVSVAVGTWLLQFGSDGYHTALRGNYIATVTYVETIPNQAVSVLSVWNGLHIAYTLPEILWCVRKDEGKSWVPERYGCV